MRSRVLGLLIPLSVAGFICLAQSSSPVFGPSFGGGGTGGTVSSVFTRTGAVVAAIGDYTAAQVTNALDLSNTGTQTMQGNLAFPSGKSLNTGIIRDTSANAVLTTGVGRATFSNGYNCTPTTITFSATPAIGLQCLQTITLTGNATPTITIASGEHLVIQICQDATGSRTWAWPASVHGGMTIGATLSTCSQQAFDSFNGTTLVAESPGVTLVAP